MIARILVTVCVAGMSGIGLLPAQDQRGEGVPILKDIPTLGHLFRNQEETLWHPLGEPRDEPGDDPEAAKKGALGFHEAWLLRTLKARCPGLRSVEVVDKVSARHDGENRTVHQERGIEARGPAEAIAKAREFLGRFAAKKEAMVRIEARIIDVGTEIRKDPDALVAVVDRKALDARVVELKTKGFGESITSPTLQVYNTQRANVRVTSQTAYIKDYEVEVVENATIADPIIGTISDGIVFDVRPVIDPDTREINVDVRVELSTLTRPIREFEAKVAGQPVTIQLPEVNYSRFGSSEVVIRPGEAGFMISGLKQIVREEGKEPRRRNVEVWCLVQIVEPGAAEPVSGEVIELDATYGNLFVRWPLAAVPDDPWDKAPKSVTVWRDGKQVGAAELNGGWTMSSLDMDDKHRVVAIYHLTEGEGRPGDTVR